MTSRECHFTEIIPYKEVTLARVIFFPSLGHQLLSADKEKLLCSSELESWFSKPQSKIFCSEVMAGPRIYDRCSIPLIARSNCTRVGNGDVFMMWHHGGPSITCSPFEKKIPNQFRRPKSIGEARFVSRPRDSLNDHSDLCNNPGEKNSLKLLHDSLYLLA